MDENSSKQRFVKVKERLGKKYEDGIIQQLNEAQDKDEVINKLDLQELTMVHDRITDEEYKDLSDRYMLACSVYVRFVKLYTQKVDDEVGSMDLQQIAEEIEVLNGFVVDLPEVVALQMKLAKRRQTLEMLEKSKLGDFSKF